MGTRTLSGGVSFAFTFAFLLVVLGPFSFGQQIGITTPAVSLGESYYESTGVNFGFRFGGANRQGSGSRGFFQQGSANSAIPPFGGYDPAGDARFGFGVVNGNGNGFSLGMRMGKGFGRSLTSNAPSVVVPNGGLGSVTDGSLRPFVTGVIPVVGFPSRSAYPSNVTPVYGPRYPSFPYADYLAQRSIERASAPRRAPARTVHYSNPESSAVRGDLSVAELKKQRKRLESQKDKELDDLIAKAKAFEEAGNIKLARLNYRRASQRARGMLRYELQTKVESLETSKKK